MIQIDNKYDQYGPGVGGRGTRKSSGTEKPRNKRKVSKAEKNKIFEMCGDFLKNRRAQRFSVYRGIINKCYKKCHMKHSLKKRRKNDQLANLRRKNDVKKKQVQTRR